MIGIVLAIGVMALGLVAIGVQAWGTREALAPHDHGVMVHAARPGETEADAQRPRTTIKPVSCEKLPNVPGKSLTTVTVEYPPNAYTPRHRHPGSVMAFVLKGKVRSQLAGGPAEVFGVGQSWFEPPGTIHQFAENASATEPAEILAIYVADNDCGPLIVFD
jgi:quercetin dioxygenase-like cupin family protein